MISIATHAMKTTIYYYTGTGNSLWTSRLIAAELGNATLHPMSLMEKGPLWQRIVFTALYKLTFNMIPKMDGDFWVDEKCNGCTICAKVCPVGNITMSADKPVWSHRCEQCLACIQWCPKEAIQYGKKTPNYERYHHPEVTLKDIVGESFGQAKN